MRGDLVSFDELGEQERINFLKDLLDDGTPNVPWIAKEHEVMLRVIWDQQEEMEGPEGQTISPRLHLTLHGIVETQYGSGDPPVVQEVVDKLRAAGWKRHDAMHLVCSANIDEILLMLRDDDRFDTTRFSQRIANLATQKKVQPTTPHPDILQAQEAKAARARPRGRRA